MNYSDKKTLDINNQLNEYSPKIYRILMHIQKYMKQGKPTGKILIYSDFRGDSGGEILEQILLANNYTLYQSSCHHPLH